MARNRGRSLPSTPDPRRAPGTPPSGSSTAGAPTPRPSAQGRAVPVRPVTKEPEYLVQGTGCTAGHEPGHELLTRRLGRVPSKRLTRIGLGLVVWCFLGSLFLAKGKWAQLAIELIVLWLALSAVVQRRAGHKGRCWRTRSWRHAWGGLVPVAAPRPRRTDS